MSSLPTLILPGGNLGVVRKRQAACVPPPGSLLHYNLRYVPGKGNCIGILTVLPRLCGYLAGRAECHDCRPCLGLQLESGSITKNSIKKSKKYSPNIQHLISFKLAIKVLCKKTTKTHKVPEIFLETMIFFCLVGGGLGM